MSTRLLFLWLSDTAFHSGKFIWPIWNFYSLTVGKLSPLQIHIGFCYTEICANLWENWSILRVEFGLCFHISCVVIVWEFFLSFLCDTFVTCHKNRCYRQGWSPYVSYYSCKYPGTLFQCLGFHGFECLVLSSNSNLPCSYFYSALEYLLKLHSFYMII